MKLIGFLFLVVLFLVACKKETKSIINPVPSITFSSFTKTTVGQFADSAFLIISYIDGDGDLGEINPDINCLEIKDSRLTKTDSYFVPPLAPVNSKVPINGKLVIKLKSLFLLGTGNTEVANFEVVIKDRSGNTSNKIKTPDVLIVK